MFCPKCGAQVENGQPFCPNCGTQFQPAAPTYPQQPAGGYPQQPQYAPRPPMDLSKIMMWVALGAMVITIILSFFGYKYGTGGWSTTGPFGSVILIADLNLFSIAFMLMPLLGFAKKGGKTNFLVLFCASLALVDILLEWIDTGISLSVCGIFALILQLGAVACCAIMFYLGLEHRPRAPRQPYPGYPQQPQYPPQP